MEIFCLFALCLLPCLPLAFALFSIFPESRSFKHLKRYMSIRKLKEIKLQTNSKKGETSTVKMEERERRKDYEMGERKG